MGRVSRYLHIEKRTASTFSTPKPQNPKSVMSKLIVSELIDKFKLSTHV
jgi:hypothetical protein